MSAARASIGLLLLFFGQCISAADSNPCNATSSAKDARLTVAVKGSHSVFQEGEIIPLVLSFTATKKDRYWADVRNYDRSGRLEIESYCVQPEAPDPLAAYFKFGLSEQGGLGSTQALSADPFTAEAELNEWRSPGPGHYRLWVVSQRVWRGADPGEQAPYSRVSEVLRSNTIEFDVRAANPKWQNEQLTNALRILSDPSSSEDAKRHASRVLRFLNTRGSTKQLAKLFFALNQLQTNGWELMLGLYGSPYHQLAIDSIRDELSAPDHAITGEFLGAMADLQVNTDPAWDAPANVQEMQAFWQKRQAHTAELRKAAVQITVAALPHKLGRARALTLDGLLMQADDDPALIHVLRPALIASWGDLPAETQNELIDYRWSLIASPEMLPILRSIVAGRAAPSRTTSAETRDAALQHIYEFDRALGRELILRDLQNVNVEPDLKVLKLLPAEDLAAAVQPAVDRISHSEARNVDYELVDRYGDSSVLGTMQAVFEGNLGKWACAPQSAMLRYFLRVAPEYGAGQVAASLAARKVTHCYSMLFQDLREHLPQAQQTAIDALNDSDPEVVQDAVIALGHWGSADAEAALWTRLQRFHQEWAGLEAQLRSTPDYESPGSRGVALEQALAHSLAQGRNWISMPDKLARIAELVWTNDDRRQIETWINEWKGGRALINPTWFPDESPTYSVLQYEMLSKDELRRKLAQFPHGTQLMWQFWQPGQIQPPVSMEKQEVVYEEIRKIAEDHGVTLGKANHP